MQYISQYLDEVKSILNQLDVNSIKKFIDLLTDLKRRNSRLFILGLGGGAGHASHAVNDFRKITGIEAYAPTDNVSELTARINDEGWETIFTGWLKGSRLNHRDALLILSVGGGNIEKGISLPLVRAIDYAKEIGSAIIGIVGRSEGYTAKKADVCIIVPQVNHRTITAHTESFQAMLWHLTVSHPLLKANEMKWESLKTTGETDETRR